MVTRRLEGFNANIVALYARGLPTRDIQALRYFVGLWSGWLVVGFMLGGVLGRRSFGGL